MKISKEDQKILNLYVDQEWSTYQIAESLSSYPNKIRRILTKHGVELRSPKKAQANALRTGRASHPTQGTVRSEETKLKISESQGEVWDSLTTEEKAHRSAMGKEAWNNRSEEEQRDFIHKAQEAVRESSRNGSKLEKFLQTELTRQNINVDFHKKQWLQNGQLEVDLYLPQYRIAIEVDGPSHFKPVWGEANLARNIKADQVKTGLILSSGLVMIRIKQDQSLTQRFLRNTLTNLLALVDQVKSKFPKENERLFSI